VHQGKITKGEKRFFRAFRATEKIMVLPWGEKPPAEGSQKNLVMEIGRARGTGLHPTTRSCLRLLEAHLSTHRPSLALDVGTGTGILALAAASLGVPRVFAIDVDSHSVNIARKNVRHNRLTGCIKVRCRDVAHEGGKYPLILVNLSHNALIRHSKALLHCICPGGRIIVGGIRRRRHQEILSHFCPPLEIEAEDKEAWWEAFVLREKEAEAV
jgi:ribosomal protein L11 methyltransferase